MQNSITESCLVAIVIYFRYCTREKGFSCFYKYKINQNECLGCRPDDKIIVITGNSDDYFWQVLAMVSMGFNCGPKTEKRQTENNFLIFFLYL